MNNTKSRGNATWRDALRALLCMAALSLTGLAVSTLVNGMSPLTLS